MRKGLGCDYNKQNISVVICDTEEFEETKRVIRIRKNMEQHETYINRG